MINLLRIEQLGKIQLDKDSLESSREIELVNLRQLKHLCRHSDSTKIEAGFEGRTLHNGLKRYILKQGFTAWIAPKKNLVQIKLKSKKTQICNKQLEIIKHDDLMELIRELLESGKIFSENPQVEINELLKQTQMNDLKPDFLLLSKLFDYLRK